MGEVAFIDNTKSRHTVFATKGTIDLNTIMTFGVSVKETENPIGQFGTGLKYAIAILLREGHEVHMYCGSQEYHFWTKEHPIRGQNFNVVMMNDYRLPFTTDLGKHWELWQAFRELYSNTLDESGECWVGEDEISSYIPDEGETVFIVTGDEFASIALDKGTVFLNSEPLFESDSMEVHDEESSVVFLRGIRVAEVERPFLFTYNIKDKMTLTEDRTLANSSAVDQYIIDSVCVSTDRTFIREIITARETFHEHSLNFHYHEWRFGETFKEVMRECIREDRASVNASLVKLYDAERKKEEKKNSRSRKRITISVDLPAHLSDFDIEYDLRKFIADQWDADSDDIEACVTDG